ncbi:hypothetical protein FB451DRAFT_1566587 [Mycena latifolia]|nr:hypothetical protein FB451DRAFT_1566587 [Mycena latifolia]
MQRMDPATSTSGHSTSSVAAPQKLPLTHSARGLRLAAAEPYGKHNLLAMTRPKGIWTFQPRQPWVREWSWGKGPAHAASWPAIPDAQLPAPFTCTWGAFHPTDNWYKLGFGEAFEDTQEELRRCWGVPGLTPVMYLAHIRNDCQHHIPVVLRAGATYYFWLYGSESIEPWLRKFEGTYECVEDFIKNADWNRLSAPMEKVDHWRERWEEEVDEEYLLLGPSPEEEEYFRRWEEEQEKRKLEWAE